MLCLGQTDMHFSSELMNPSWYCYAMRKYSPFKENVNKWYAQQQIQNMLLPNDIRVILKGSAICSIWSESEMV